MRPLCAAVRSAHGVKRQKLHPAVVSQAMEYIAVACPVKSGSRAETHRQYVSDDALYEGYVQTAVNAVSFNTFAESLQDALLSVHVARTVGHKVRPQAHHASLLRFLPRSLSR